MILISDAIYLQGFPILSLSALHLSVTSYLKKNGRELQNTKIPPFDTQLLTKISLL